MFTGLACLVILCEMSGAPTNSDFQIIPRSTWSVIAPDHNATGEHGKYDAVTNPSGWMTYGKPLSKVLDLIVIHHSALPLSDGPNQIQQKHIHERGFADIGYHFVINEKGEIFEGREISVRGAHVAGHNTGAIGIVLLGNFDEAIPTERQIASTKALLKYLASTYKVSRLVGHHDFLSGTTACPGKNLAALLPEFAKGCGLEFGFKGTADYAEAVSQPLQRIIP